MEKLLAITTIAQRVYGRWLFQNLLLGMIVVMVLTIVISIVASTLLLLCLYAVYALLIYMGIAYYYTFLIIFILSAAVIAVLLILTLACQRQIRQMPRKLLEKLPLTSRPIEVWEAFYSGFMNLK